MTYVSNKFSFIPLSQVFNSFKSFNFCKSVLAIVFFKPGKNKKKTLNLEDDY